MPVPGWTPSVIILCILFGCAVVSALAAVIYRDSTGFVKAEYRVCSDRLKKDCKIVLLSDLHNKSYGEKNCRLLQAIEEQKPDMIVIAGDMLTADEEKTEYDVPLSLIGSLAEKYPVYYGTGNHEYRMKVYREKYGDIYGAYGKRLAACGVRILENERIFLPEYNMEICGLEIERHYYKRFYLRPMGEDYVEKLMGKCREDCFELMIAHNPDYFESYAGWGADLTVSGHVHGGVLRLPVLGGVISPMLRLFPKYDGGLYESHGKQMVLSRGLGMHTIPVRIFNPGELVVIRLERGAR